MLETTLNDTIPVLLKLASRLGQVGAPKLADEVLKLAQENALLQQQRIQKLRQIQQNPRYRVQQEEASLIGKEYRSRVIAAVQEIQKAIPGLVWDDQRGKNVVELLRGRLQAIIAGLDNLTSRQIGRSLSILLQYLEAAVGKQDWIKESENKQRILAHNSEIYNRFKQLVEGLGWRSGGYETQRV